MTSTRMLKLSGAALGALAVAGVGPALANDDVVALAADAGNVLMPSISYNGWNYSTLDQITLDNVDQLRIAWTWQVGIMDAHEASPLVIGDTMYIVSPKPNYVYALDLTRDGVILWEFRPDMNVEEATRQGCCGAQTRGLNYAEGKVFFNTLDGQFFGLDAATGEALWRTVGADLSIGETTVGNMIVIGDLLIGGNAGGERGVRGKVQAFNIDSGQLQWVMYNMGPDNEVGITPGYTAFYADNQTSLSTWYGDSWRRGGGTVWGYLTADLERNAFYYSTGNCGPWNPDYRREWGVVTLDERGGLIDYRNNWCASTLARDATTGHLIWAFNNTPADPWDLDEPLVNLLITIDGRDTVTRAARTGFFHVWDRDTGEMVFEPWNFVYTDNILGYDMETGRALIDIDKWLFTNVEDRRRYTQADPGTRLDGTQVADYTGTEVEWCPSIAARNWQNDAYSPRTGLVYTSTLTNCRSQVVFEGDYVPGEGYTLQRQAGAVPRQPRNADGTVPAPGTVTTAMRREAANRVTHQNELQANSPTESRTVWRFITEQANNTPIMATATDLLFQGGLDAGVMRAFDATNGDVVWEFRTGSAFFQSPITYIGPDGKQYVAIISSNRGVNAAVAFDANPDDANRYRRTGSTLYVFALPDAVAAN